MMGPPRGPIFPVEGEAAQAAAIQERLMSDILWLALVAAGIAVMYKLGAFR